MDGLSARVQEFMDGLSARDRVELRELHQGRDRSQFTARLKELGFTKLGQRIKVEQALPAERRVPQSLNFALLGNPGTGKVPLPPYRTFPASDTQHLVRGRRRWRGFWAGCSRSLASGTTTTS